jgi:hypothetical protein
MKNSILGDPSPERVALTEKPISAEELELQHHSLRPFGGAAGVRSVRFI